MTLGGCEAPSRGDEEGPSCQWHGVSPMNRRVLGVTPSEPRLEVVLK